ncbi:fibronectin type III domain-containing protein [bacterium]|nr:fibronectin type III domain-containing protein [bacterium]
MKCGTGNSYFCLLVVGMLIALTALELFAEEIPFSDVRIIIEFNSTDEDIGIQVFLDAEGWKKVSIQNPGGNTVFEVVGSKNIRRQGLTELFFESEEPGLDEVPLSQFLARFPEGEYKFFGSTNEGDELVGTATLTHNIPDGPEIVSPEKGDVLDPKKVTIRWEPVTTPAGIVIAGYQVIVEGDRPLRHFQIDLPADATSVKVPSNFLESGQKYKFEVLAKEIGGNQTISERKFRTE